MTPQDESSSGVETTTTGVPPVTTSDSADSSSSGPADSSGTTAADSTTAVAESSTGPVEACGNGAIDDEEVCDGTELGGQDCVAEGFDGGDLACADDCAGYDTRGCANFSCGNNTAEGKEACDGNDFGGATCQSEGFDNGTLSCALNCGTLNTSDCGSCGNVIVDGEEACDGIVLFGQDCESQGFTGGVLGCNADCLTFDTANCITCGNDVIDGVEPCDGVDLDGQTCATQGFVGGTLACAEDLCTFDTSGCNGCGNGIVDAGEGCDGANLDGETCASLGLTGGTLSCSPSCQFDFNECEIPGSLFGSDSGYNGYEIQGAPLPCDNIVATGTPTNLTDDSQIVVPMGFSFPVYGVDYTDVTIESNGALHWSNGDYMTYNNTCLPTATAPTANNLYVFWDDLNATTGGDAYYQTLGAVGSRRFVVQWSIAHHLGDAVDLIDVRATLHEATGQIEVCYPDTLSLANAGNNGAEATSGMQHGTADGFDFSCNTPDLTNGTLLLYIPI